MKVTGGCVVRSGLTQLIFCWPTDNYNYMIDWCTYSGNPTSNFCRLDSGKFPTPSQRQIVIKRTIIATSPSVPVEQWVGCSLVHLMVPGLNPTIYFIFLFYLSYFQSNLWLGFGLVFYKYYN